MVGWRERQVEAHAQVAGGVEPLEPLDVRHRLPSGEVLGRRRGKPRRSARTAGCTLLAELAPRARHGGRRSRRASPRRGAPRSRRRRTPGSHPARCRRRRAAVPAPTRRRASCSRRSSRRTPAGGCPGPDCGSPWRSARAAGKTRQDRKRLNASRRTNRRTRRRSPRCRIPSAVAKSSSSEIWNSSSRG